MKPFYNTPTPFGSPPEKKVRDGIDLVYWLEDNYSEWVRDCANGLCKYDSREAAKFEADIKAARKKTFSPP